DAAVAALRDDGRLPAGAEVLGPVPDDSRTGPGLEDRDRVRYLVRVPRGQGAALSTSLREMQSLRAARKAPHLRVEVEPAALG
ncbi:MAG: primosome assembly protein PriA, partial [Marmoricola sp.]